MTGAIGIVGLGRMGAKMARRLARGGVRVAGYDRDAAAREALAVETGVDRVASLEAACTGAAGARVVLVMLPAGAPTGEAIEALAARLAPGDTLVDGGNSWYRDSMRRAASLAARGLRFVDAGVSGGVHGLAQGYCLTLGGEAEAVRAFAPFARLLAPAPDRGWLHCGPSGAGHYAKMIHNGIEYGMMQALAEGLALVRAKRELDIDPGRLADTWRHGSVIRSWLLDLSADFLSKPGALDGVAPVVADSGEGRWTALESVELGVPAPAITLALMARFASQGRADDAQRMLALMRAAFGGHAVERG